MQTVERPLLILHGNRTLREQLRAAARSGGYQLAYVEDWGDLHAEVRTTPASAMLVVDPHWGSGPDRALAPELASLLSDFPSLSVAAALPLGEGGGAELLTLGEWGVTQIVDTDEEATATALSRRLDEARGRPLRRLVEASLPAAMGGPARSILAAATTVVAEGGQGTDLARVLGVTGRTLTRWCRRAALPPPKRLLAWMRILLAAELMDDPGRTISDVAVSCGYAAGSSLRHAVGRLTGLTPSELRDRGAFRTASRGFVKALVEARSPAKRYRTPTGER